MSKTANLRRRLERLLGTPVEHTKRLNLRDRVQAVGFTQTASDFESQFLLYKCQREISPKTYGARLRLRPAPLIKLHLQNEYPRASVTTRLSASGKNLYYGPFPSRALAEKFSNDALDLFKMRRCVDDLHPDPAFPGCVYSEMKMCLAPCFRGCTDDEYRGEVGRVQSFFDTAGESLTQELAGQREQASTELEFEAAAAIHTKIEKLKSMLTPLPEIVRRIDCLVAIIVQPCVAPGSVSLFRFAQTQITGPVIFQIEDRGELLLSQSEAAPAEPPARPRAMETRVQERIEAFSEARPLSAVEQNEQLAILKQWYYRSHRVGEIFFADEQGRWPLRRIVRGIGRVYRGERNEEHTPEGASHS